jgi:hypothetical protein
LRVVSEIPDGTVAERLGHLYEVVLCREPQEGEVRHLEAVYRDRAAQLTEAPGVADEVIQGASSVVQAQKGVENVELAAWLHVTTILLNLDETITKG